MTNIVCYTGGTCGDLISALIDPSGAIINPNGSVTHLSERTKLKKPHLFANDCEKDLYVESVTYQSISSHDTEYHIRKQHRFITISVRDFDTALWASNRFKTMHRDAVWEEMQAKCGAGSIEEYARSMINHTNMVVDTGVSAVNLESILSGDACNELEAIICRPLESAAVDFYKNWLLLQK